MNYVIRFVSVVFVASLFMAGHASQRVYAQSRGKLEVPFTLTKHNNIVVKVMLNRTEALELMLHTAEADVTLTEDAVRKSSSVKFKAAVKTEAWGGEADSRFSTGNHLQIGGRQWERILVWEDKHSGIGTDGKFGLDLFKGQVVEIDFDQQRLTVYNQLPAKAKKYQRLKLENGKGGNLFVEANCVIEGQAYPNRFLIHSGYSGGLLLDDGFVARTGIDGKVKITEESALKDSFGNTIKVKKAILPALGLGDTQFQDVPTGFFSGAIGRQKMSVMGGEVLKRFNLILDLTHNSLYVSPRQLPKLPTAQ
jgi:hypothetical protein